MRSTPTPNHRTGQEPWWFAGGVAAMTVLVRAHVDGAFARFLEEHDLGPDVGADLSVSTAAAPHVSACDVVTSCLPDRVARLRRVACRAAGRRPPRGVPDLSGVWRGENGATYRLDQYGDLVVLQETVSAGITALGLGLVSGTCLWTEYEAADGSWGEADLTLDHGVLRGSFSNNAFATCVGVTLRR